MLDRWFASLADASALRAQLPYLMIPALEKVALSLDDSKDLVIRAMAVGTPDLMNLASSVSAWRLDSHLVAWRQILINTAGEKEWTPTMLAQRERPVIPPCLVAIAA